MPHGPCAAVAYESQGCFQIVVGLELIENPRGCQARSPILCHVPNSSGGATSTAKSSDIRLHINGYQRDLRSCYGFWKDLASRFPLHHCLFPSANSAPLVRLSPINLRLHCALAAPCSLLPAFIICLRASRLPLLVCWLGSPHPRQVCSMSRLISQLSGYHTAMRRQDHSSVSFICCPAMLD